MTVKSVSSTKPVVGKILTVPPNGGVDVTNAVARVVEAMGYKILVAVTVTVYVVNA